MDKEKEIYIDLVGDGFNWVNKKQWNFEFDCEMNDTVLEYSGKEFKNLYKNHENVTSEQFKEAIITIATYMCQHNAWRSIYNLNRLDEEYGEILEGEKE